MIVTLLLIMSPFLFRHAYIRYRNVKNMYSILLAIYVQMVWFTEKLKSDKPKPVDNSEWILLNRNEFEKCKME